ncbi:UDP-N-acetylmuramoyl-L-alanyl-D-glutamate--L-lysine ligase [Tetragenococcus osmophilus]|uniref:UDP-N-acetylmuramoyl-L-alanyl-D-glutamate--L-lysi ne ligase n=1 Tax=Tetragenococcus osmophilus TaxID=526944 RepID=A0AA38CWA5_9ENTE|nr:UDP-N-acetylmuramyl-tripeptide synthetase [Tetragenococcus osmophilus]AYW47585.1 UDP-N-acetylmuramoyl-L-alanyl-D-glutamate--L-lysine ligase [Tetragenococcus osmophilus]GMA53210.1 UDP-N-acetylmuramoyl-L-alanyl-D-glutamate--L-lysi ne ligase [Alicyclobacillus contaminans]GMA72818.1 UDP-N-acetylmuramoyl-L-alanyl-D-glutamate--L-lysi ne ligase [Tetragenococcus osmophilus]
MYSITLEQLYQILSEKDLLQTPNENMKTNQTFTYLSYDSRDLAEHTLFFCKGLHFNVASLHDAIHKGVEVYVSEIKYESSAQAVLVTDIRKAMAVVAQYFYHNPQDNLYKIGITGTKGKTTTAYFVKKILDDAFNKKVALFSSEETTLDGTTFSSSALTTPEALDLYRQMATACENGLTHLVMEVSSQAYKTQRVYNLTFETGVFLNISPDHISPIEHPTFEDYFQCKRQLLLNSKQMVINQESDQFARLKQTCVDYQIPLYTYGYELGTYLLADKAEERTFKLTAKNKDSLGIDGSYQLALFGQFNHENAAAAILVCGLANVSKQMCQESLPLAQIPGRMNLLEKPNGAYVFVDYAHNYLSIHAIGRFARQLRPEGRLIIVTGSAGGKAISRRPDIGRALSECADVAIITSDDPDFEDPKDIASEITTAITNPNVNIQLELNRAVAVTSAFNQAKSKDTVIIAGKGTEKMMKYRGEESFYEGDFHIVKRLINETK